MISETLAVLLRPSDQCDPLAADTIFEENVAEHFGQLDPYDRVTCPLHETWLYRCVHAADHIDVLTGYRWCRACRQLLEVAVDEPNGEFELRCPSCHRGRQTAMDDRLLRACRESFAAARAHVLTNA